MTHIIKDAKLDTLTINQTLIHPVSERDTLAPIKGKFIHNVNTNVPSFADGTGWHDLISEVDLASINQEIDDITGDLSIIQGEIDLIAGAPIALMSADALFPNGGVIAAGTGITIVPTPGFFTINATGGVALVTKSARASTLPQGFIVPAGAINPKIYACGGGGGGGGANLISNDKGAGGGGSGSWMIYTCSPGDVINYSLGSVGAGGVAGSGGSPGGSTLVTINNIPGPTFGGGDGGDASGTGTGGGGGTPVVSAFASYPVGFVSGATGGEGGDLAATGNVGFWTAFKFAGGAGGGSGGSGGGGGGGAGSIFAIGGVGGASGSGGLNAGGYGAGGGGSSGVMSSAVGGDGGGGEVVLTYWA